MRKLHLLAAIALVPLSLALGQSLFSAMEVQAQNTQCSDRPTGDSSNACADTRFVSTATGGGSPQRKRLAANADYYVSKGGNDACNGTANVRAASGNCSWLTINKALTFISQNVDFNGQNVIVHVQGTTDPSGASTGVYTENLLVPAWVGYNGNGFGQWIVQGENGTVTLTGLAATATILAAIGGNADPIQFKTMTIANANASGISVESDDGGFIALNTITFGSTGAGGILTEAVHVGGRILFMGGTFTMASGLSTGTGFYGRDAGGIIFQPGVTINFAGASTFSNAVADIATNAYFEDTGSTWSGTVPTGKKYVLDKNSGGLIVDASLITGSVAATLTPIAVGNGGTGDLTLTNHGVLLGAGAAAANAVVGNSGTVLQAVTGNDPAFTPNPLLGTAGSVVGTIGFLNASSGVITFQPITGALGNSTQTLQAKSGTVALNAPTTIQNFVTGINLTYSTPASATWLEFEMVGAGAGGAGSGTTPGAATSGSATCVNTAGTACSSPLYQAGGGTLGSAAGATSAAGGTVSGSATCSDSQPGGAGGPGPIANSQAGGVGGSSRYGGFGQAGWGGANNATAAAANSGSGGGGSGQNATANGGGGGGAGAWCYVIIPSPIASYTYTIGTAGAAGTAGAGGNAGAAGAVGKLRVIEHYQ